jgi:hypothetical protein
VSIGCCFACCWSCCVAALPQGHLKTAAYQLSQHRARLHHTTYELCAADASGGLCTTAAQVPVILCCTQLLLYRAFAQVLYCSCRIAPSRSVLLLMSCHVAASGPLTPNAVDCISHNHLLIVSPAPHPPPPPPHFRGPCCCPPWLATQCYSPKLPEAEKFLRISSYSFTFRPASCRGLKQQCAHMLLCCPAHLLAVCALEQRSMSRQAS